MNAHAARLLAPPVLGDLLEDYRRFVSDLSCGEQGKRLRRRGAREFEARWPDLHAWMQRPTSARLTDVARIPGSWPFLSWCFVAGVVIPDVDLLGARANGNHFRAWGKVHHEDVARAEAVAQQLGWARAWTHQICETQLAMVCLTSAKTLDHPDADVLDHFAAELADAPTINANHRRVIGSRLHGLTQVCFQLGLVDTPPEHPNRRHQSNRRSRGGHTSSADPRPRCPLA